MASSKSDHQASLIVAKLLRDKKLIERTLKGRGFRRAIKWQNEAGL
jgi:hypothetical protein